MRFVLIRAFIIIAAILLAVIAGIIYVNRQSTTYDAKAKILIDQPRLILLPNGAVNPIIKIGQLMSTYVEEVQSYPMADEVAKRLSGVSTEEVQKSLSAAKIEDTQIFIIDANNSRAVRAQDIAATAADVFMEKVQKDQERAKVVPEDRLVLSVVDPPLSKEIAPAKNKTIGMAALFGLVFSVSGVAIYENARRS